MYNRFAHLTWRNARKIWRLIISLRVSILMLLQPQKQNKFESLYVTSNSQGVITSNIVWWSHGVRVHAEGAWASVGISQKSNPTDTISTPDCAQFCQKQSCSSSCSRSTTLHPQPDSTSPRRRRDADVPSSDMPLAIHVLTTLGEFYLLRLCANLPNL